MRILALIVALAACSDGNKSPTPKHPLPAAEVEKTPETWTVPADKQRAGDPVRGRHALLNENYIGCGVPDSVLDRVGGLGSPSAVPGREPLSTNLPFFLTRYNKPDGTGIVTANCLGCHGARLNGELVIGLGMTSSDFTVDPTGPLAMLGRFTRGEAGEELELLLSRLEALYPAILLPTAGPSSADHIAAVLFAHRDPDTLAWSDEPLMKPPEHDAIPVDVPAWWLLKKKNAMFYTAAGRGDHARIMMTASALCTDSVEQAERIDAYFGDIRAFIVSLEAPPYPYEIKRESADRGKVVFEKTCSRCHGTYDADPAKETYPNRVVSIDVIKTDPKLAVGSGQFSSRFVDWFNRSFYGKTARLEPQRGYIAPPLDGVWATAPYFHNGSVPTIGHVLDSPARPKTWRRRGRVFDEALVGWQVATAVAPNESKWVYDTSRPGHAATGHTFGDKLSARERTDVIEYLKTL